MKKILTAAVALGLTLSLTACGESLQRPVETTPSEPLWALAPEERPTVDPAEALLTEAVTEPVPAETEAPTTAATVPAETVPETTALPEPTASPETTPAVIAEEGPGIPADARDKMEEKFKFAEGKVFAKKEVNVRDQANTDSIILKRLKKAEAVDRIGQSEDGWTAIWYGERVCYVSSEYLVEEKPEGTEPNPDLPTEQPMDDQVYTNHNVNMREGPGMDKAVLCKVPEYTELHRIGYVTSGWHKVEYKDQVGYIIEGYIMPKYVDSEEHPEETVVDETVHTTREVNLRKGPGTDRQILDRVPEGTELKRIATTSNEWSKVIYNGVEGYISSKYIETGSLPQSEG